MWRTLTFILISFISHGTIAQEDEDFNHLGQTLFQQVTDTSFEGYVELIRVKAHRQLMDRQPMDTKRRMKLRHRVNETHSQLYKDWKWSIEQLQETYIGEREQGTRLEYLTTRHFPSDKFSDVYEVYTSFLYRNGKVQNEVILSYKVAWIGDRLVMMSPVKEKF